MIRAFYKPSKNGIFQEVSDFRKGTWIQVTDATAHDLDQIMEITDIDYTHLKDSLDRYELPRVEQEDGNILLFTRHPSTEEHGLYTTVLTIILTSDYFITISLQKNDLLEPILQGEWRISSMQTSKLLFHILLKITHN